MDRKDGESRVRKANLSEIKLDSANINAHSERGQAMTTASLEKFKARLAGILDRNNVVIDGNLRSEIYADKGVDEIEIIEGSADRPLYIRYDDLDLADPDNPARELQVALHRSAVESWTVDAEALLAHMQSGVEVDDWFRQDELDELMGQITPPNAGADTEPQIDRAEELRQKWGVSSGQMWALGEHRLMCGDCTDKATVERLMSGEKAEMVWTDPPYGVAVGDKNKFLNSIAPSNRIEENLENDTLDEPQLMQMLRSAFDNALSVCLAGGAWYVAAPAGPLHVLFGQALKERGIWHQTIQWVKNNATFSPMGVDYHWQAEPIFYGWAPGAGHRYYGGRQQTTVWEIDRPLKSPEHPTMKPVGLVERSIENSSRRGEIVFDPFSGSGTTLIACENLVRRGRAIELDAGYAATILQRWADHTGKTPTLLG